MNLIPISWLKKLRHREVTSLVQVIANQKRPELSGSGCSLLNLHSVKDSTVSGIWTGIQNQVKHVEQKCILNKRLERQEHGRGTPVSFSPLGNDSVAK